MWGGREADRPGVRVVVGRSASCQGCSVCPHQRGWRIGQAGFWAGCWGSCAKLGGPRGCLGLGVPSPAPGIMMMMRKKHTFGLLCSKSIRQVSASPTVPSLPPSFPACIFVRDSSHPALHPPSSPSPSPCLPAYLLLSLILGFNTRTPWRIHGTNPTRKTTTELGEPPDLSLSKIS